MRVAWYVTRRNIVRLTWLGPASGYLIVVLALIPFAAPLGGTVAILGIATMILATWVSVSSIDGDDPGQKSAVAVLSGGLLRARNGDLFASLAFVLALSAVGFTVAVVRSASLPTETPLYARLFWGSLTLAVLASVGASLGYLVAWPVLRRTPLAMSVGIMLALALVIVPGSPVNGLLLSAASIDGDVSALTFSAHAAVCLVLSIAAVAAARTAVNRRWQLGRPQ